MDRSRSPRALGPPRTARNGTTRLPSATRRGWDIRSSHRLSRRLAFAHEPGLSARHRTVHRVRAGLGTPRARRAQGLALAAWRCSSSGMPKPVIGRSGRETTVNAPSTNGAGDRPRGWSSYWPSIRWTGWSRALICAVPRPSSRWPRSAASRSRSGRSCRTERGSGRSGPNRSHGRDRTDGRHRSQRSGGRYRSDGRPGTSRHYRRHRSSRGHRADRPAQKA